MGFHMYSDLHWPSIIWQRVYKFDHFIQGKDLAVSKRREWYIMFDSSDIRNTYGCLNTSIFTYTLARKNLLINRLYPLAFSLLERNLKKYYSHSYRNWQDWNWRDRSSETTFLRLNICVPLTFKKCFKILKCQLYFKKL